jgi:uncharacterized membrane protein (DUF485 family)
MDDNTLARIKNDPNYKALVAERTSFGWTLAILTIILYYGYVAIVAFSPATIAMKVSGNITVGILMGVGLILISIILTGVYVLRANSRYDELTKSIVQSATTGGRK